MAVQSEPNSVTTDLRAADLAQRIDHTLLRPEATRADVEEAAVFAAELRCAAICVHSEHVAFVRGVVGRHVAVCSVVAFPHGAVPAGVKAAEAASAVAHGAGEIDVVLALGPIAEDDLAHVAHELAVVREAVPDVVLKAIVESALWSPAVLRGVCEAAVDGGADFVKTSTGFHPAGGASVEAVSTMSAAVGTRARVKASGGIRTLADARSMLEAGADRLGLSASAAILGELAPDAASAQSGRQRAE